MSALEYVPDGTPLKCSAALDPESKKMTVTNNNNVLLYGEKMASSADMVAITNIPCFGKCKAAGLQQCVPSPILWENVSSKTTVNGNNYLLSDSFFICSLGGKVEVDLKTTSNTSEEESSIYNKEKNTTTNKSYSNNQNASNPNQETEGNPEKSLLTKAHEGYEYGRSEEARRDLFKFIDEKRESNDKTFYDIGFDCLAENPTQLMPGTIDFMQGCFPPPKFIDGLKAIPQDFIVSRGQDLASIPADIAELGGTLWDIGENTIDGAPEVYKNLSNASYEDYKEMGNAMLENLKSLPSDVGGAIGQIASDKWKDVTNAWDSVGSFWSDPSAVNGSLLSTNVSKIIPEGIKRPVKSINDMISPKNGKVNAVDEKKAREEKKKKEEEERKKREAEEAKKKEEQENSIDDEFDPENASNKQKGNYGEIKSNDNKINNPELKEKGYDLNRMGENAPDGLDAKIQKGIDGIYENSTPPPKFVIDEAKFNTASLGKTLDGKQMSDDWIKGSNRLEIQLGKIDADRVIEAFEDGEVERVLTRINKAGDVVTKKLDEYGNIIGEWP